MSTSVSIEPSDFILPPGPKIVVIRVDRDALQYLDPSMDDPLTDTDSSSRILRKGRTALEQVRPKISVKLFGADIPCLASTTCWPDPPGTAPFRPKYIGFYFKHCVGAGDVCPPVFDLTSEADLVDGCVCFHAKEVGEDRKDGVLEHVGFMEEAIRNQAAKRLQAAQ